MSFIDPILIKLGLKKPVESPQVQPQAEGVVAPVPGEAINPAENPIVTGDSQEGSAMLGATNLAPTPEGTQVQTIGPLTTPDTTPQATPEGSPTTPETTILPKPMDRAPLQSSPSEKVG